MRVKSFGEETFSFFVQNKYKNYYVQLTTTYFNVWANLIRIQNGMSNKWVYGGMSYVDVNK